MLYQLVLTKLHNNFFKKNLIGNCEYSKNKLDHFKNAKNQTKNYLLE